MKRYTITIDFKHSYKGLFDVNYIGTKSIIEDVKTLREALNYNDIIDDSVSKAYIIDNVTDKIIWLKE